MTNVKHFFRLINIFLKKMAIGADPDISG